MAKQSGLHQIKGKVGGFSYYRQSGVQNGLLRRINEAMSGRVKTGDEFANTRLNNAEFGAAADVAKLMGQMISPKFRPMVLPFSQSKLTKDIYGLAKLVEGDWGKRSIVEDQIDQVVEALNKLAKNDFISMYGLPTVVYKAAGTDTVSFALTAEAAVNLSGLGIDGITMSFRSFNLMAGQYSAVLDKILVSALGRTAIASEDFLIDVEDGYNFSTDLAYDQVTPSGYEGLRIIVCVALPYRTINDKKHILQEYCSFYALPAVTA